jgi:hypothetical protein
VLGRRFPQFLQIAQVICVYCEARLAVVASLNDVPGDAGEIKTRLVRHGVLPLRWIASGCTADETVVVGSALVAGYLVTQLGVGK